MVDIKRTDITNNHEHCNNCETLINRVWLDGISALDTKDIKLCNYYADDSSKYLIRCLVEAYEQSSSFFVKPTIVTDGRYDHYNHTYISNYDLEEIIIRSDTNILLIYGESGIGKSTFMNQLYQTVCLYSLKNDCCILPIFLNGRSFGESEEKPYEWIQNFLNSKYKYVDMNPAFFSSEVQIVIFLDAIDDIQYDNYEDLQRKISMWRSFIDDAFNRYDEVKFVVSTKNRDSLSDFEIHNYIRLFLKPWDNDKIESFLKKANCLQSKIDDIIRLANDLPFLHIPFFLNRMLNFHGSSVQSKTDVVELFIEEILKQNIRNNKYYGKIRTRYSLCNKTCIDIRLDDTTFLEVLSKIAFEKKQVTEDLIAQYVHGKSRDFIHLALSCSILEKDRDKFFRFTHNIIEDFFSARYIVKELEGKYDDFTADDLPHIQDNERFSLALRHVYNFLPNKQHLVKVLIADNKLGFAADCALESEDAQVQNIVKQHIVRFLEDCQCISQKGIEYGLYLGRLGDIRITPYVEDPAIEFVLPRTVTVDDTGLNVGVFPITNLEYSYFIKDNGYQNNTFWQDASHCWFDYENKINSICEFWLNIQKRLQNNPDAFFDFCKSHYFDKELIANLVFFKTIPQDDFQVMIRNLYSQEKETVPLMWDNPLYNNPSQPVVGVSIYEAFAYCEWLSAKSNKTFRLLTHEEWEKAAHANTMRYAYGKHFDKQKSNTSETGLRCVVPVGICKTNRTLDGLYDLTGNIFEWTSTLYNMKSDDYYQNDNLLFRQYICKGGSWIQDSQRAESKYVGRGMGWVRNLDVGFRVCYKL